MIPRRSRRSRIVSLTATLLLVLGGPLLAGQAAAVEWIGDAARAGCARDPRTWPQDVSRARLERTDGRPWGTGDELILYWDCNGNGRYDGPEPVIAFPYLLFHFDSYPCERNPLWMTELAVKTYRGPGALLIVAYRDCNANGDPDGGREPWLPFWVPFHDLHVEEEPGGKTVIWYDVNQNGRQDGPDVRVEPDWFLLLVDYLTTPGGSGSFQNPRPRPYHP